MKMSRELNRLINSIVFIHIDDIHRSDHIFRNYIEEIINKIYFLDRFELQCQTIPEYHISIIIKFTKIYQGHSTLYYKLLLIIMFFMEDESNINKILDNKFCSNLKPKILDTLFSRVTQNNIIISKINKTLTDYIEKHKINMFQIIYNNTTLPSDLIRIIVNYLDYQDYIKIDSDLTINTLFDHV